MLVKPPYFDELYWSVIVPRLGIDPASDCLAASEARLSVGRACAMQCLSEVMLSLHTKPRPVVVVGPDPSLPTTLPKLLDRVSVDDVLLVAVDGATRMFLELGAVPHLVVTDLDGGLDIVVEAARLGSKIFLHFHGDNAHLAKSVARIIERSCIPTVQVCEGLHAMNPGGFTDGDRAIALALQLAPPTVPILVFCMDYGSTVGRYSKPYLGKDAPLWVRKEVKFSIARKIISKLYEQYGYRFFFVERGPPEAKVVSFDRALEAISAAL